MQLSAEINFKSLKPGSDETRVMYTRSDNEECMSGDDTNEIIKLLFESFLQRFEGNLQNKMRGSEFEFDGINFFYYSFNKTSIYRGRTYIDSPKWLKNKKSTINPKNNDDKCFQYVCFYHVTYAFRSESTFSSCLNVKEFLARSRREI